MTLCLDDGVNNCHSIIPSRMRRKIIFLVNYDSVLKDRLHTIMEKKSKEEDKGSVQSSNFVSFSNSGTLDLFLDNAWYLLGKLKDQLELVIYKGIQIILWKTFEWKMEKFEVLSDLVCIIQQSILPIEKLMTGMMKKLSLLTILALLIYKTVKKKMLKMLLMNLKKT